MEIRGTATVITGAGRGLGAALARELGQKGARLVLVARNLAEAEQVAASIRASGGEAHALAADVGDKEAIHRIAGAAAALVGPVRLLVNNASTLGPVPLGLLADTACEELERVLEVNLVGPFRLTKALLGGMVLGGGGGLVINISSDAAVNGYPRWGAYGVSKAALDHLTRTWAAELVDSGVRFFAIDPGEMDTRMHADAIPDADPATLTDPQVVARRLAQVIERAERIGSGSRFEAALWEQEVK